MKLLETGRLTARFPLRLFIGLFLTAHAMTSLAGDDAPGPAWRQSVPRISREAYVETLRFWASRHPQILELKTVGHSLEGEPLSLLVVTDQSVPDDDKQICFITSLHGGPERTGTSTILHLAEWLLSDQAEAVETRRRQVVLLMPIVNPHAYFETDRFGNSLGIDPYTGGGVANWDLTKMAFKHPEKAPELMAVLSVMDAYQPDVHADLHGIGLQEYPSEKLGDRTLYSGQTMFEVTGSAYSNHTLRPWDWRITEAMVSAGVAAGYGSDRFEADAQRLLWGSNLTQASQQLWLGHSNFYTAQYGYHNFHTMIMALEIGWEASGVARLRGLLRVGNQVWPGESHRGYPVDRVKSFIGHFVTATGETASNRRASRIELWQKQSRFTQAVLYPQTDGRDTYIVATTPEAAECIAESPTDLLSNIRNLPEFDSEALGQFIDAGPEIKVVIQPGHVKGSADVSRLKNGIGFRLRLPYQQVTALEVFLNGQLLTADSEVHYSTWGGSGFTELQIDVPPDQLDARGLYFVTCKYQGEQPREHGWRPPQEVVKRLNRH
jgi:hypothetical protein